jgi:CO dehydrogenase maturation factor
LDQKKVISISGKGGVGKTTVAALILKNLINNYSKSILVVDADPATNLPDVLGVGIKKTVGMVVDELKQKMSEAKISSMISKESILEAWIYGVIAESNSFDLLAMGKSEGEGCYCMVNRMLTKIVDSISKNYDISIMDMEAGLEHLSRRTDRNVDVMLVVTDVSKMGIHTAKRIKEIAEAVHINFNKIYLVGNNVSDNTIESLNKQSNNIGIPLVGIIPSDPIVMDFNIKGKSLLDISRESASFKAVSELVHKIELI